MTQSHRIDLRLVAAVFLSAALILVLRTWMGQGGEPFFGDTDDAMRMVVVRDFLAGQGWYDLTQHRLNTPWGAEIHWSRLVDLPLALLVFVATPLFGAADAAIFAGTVWPLLLLLALLWLSARLALRLAGPEAVLPALILPMLSAAITAEFAPGRIDHHNLVVVLTLAAVWAAVEAVSRPRFAWLAGLFAALGLTVATESLPAAVAAILVFGLGYVFDPGRARAMRHFGLAFGLATAAGLALTRPPARWLEGACDMISPTYAGAALWVAVVFAAVSLLPASQKSWQRLLLLAIPGATGVAGIVAVLYPECLGGPYGALDPWLQENWIGAITEAKPWHETLLDLPAYAVSVGVPILLGLGVVVLRLWRVKAQRAEWLVLFAFLFATAAVMLVQTRGARLAVMPAIPAAAWVIVTARHRYLASRSLAAAGGLVVSWLMFSGAVLALAMTGLTALLPGRAETVAAVLESKDQCLVPAAFADLAPLPPERIMTPIDLGAHLLLETPHAVVAAPYHRNEAGVLDAFRFFNGPISEARGIAEARGIGLVVLCPAMPEMRGLAGRAEDSFIELVGAGTLPDWLEEVTLPESALRVFAVLPQ
ncbi:hypothetical protein ACFSX5_10995 [Devosia albogilva]|uniref:Glycosyltransferase RgtA/B/C/D-like domain-containing protein n=1 Tax=Devosia albogilva TaxID=429726 RepID=A0ABW5QL34_9HYPH